VKSKTARLCVILLLAVMLAACAAAKRNDGLRSRLYTYAAAIRWNEIDQAVGYFDPAILEAHPFTSSDRERWAAVQVSRYVEGPQTVTADGDVLQTVEIELIDRATQTVRSVIDRQRWHYDSEAAQWWLETGLPSLD
jgi:hypothetical protein